MILLLGLLEFELIFARTWFSIAFRDDILDPKDSWRQWWQGQRQKRRALAKRKPTFISDLEGGFTRTIFNTLRVESSVHFRRTIAPRGWAIKFMADTTDDNAARGRGTGRPYSATALNCITERITQTVVMAFQLECTCRVTLVASLSIR